MDNFSSEFNGRGEEVEIPQAVYDVDPQSKANRDHNLPMPRRGSLSSLDSSSDISPSNENSASSHSTPPPAPKALVDAELEESYLTVDFALFERVVFDCSHDPAGIAEAADKVVNDAEYMRQRDAYVAAVNPVYFKRSRDYYIDHWDYENDPSITDLGISMFDSIVTRARVLHLELKPYVYDVEYRRRFSPEEKYTPEYCGMLRGSPPASLKDWSRVLFVFDFYQPRRSLQSQNCTTDEETDEEADEEPRETKRRRLEGSDQSRGNVQSSNAHSRTDSETTLAIEDYAPRIFSAVGNRRHLLGAVVIGPRVHFWYGDRAGCVFATSLHLVKDATKIVSAFIRLSFLSAEQLGFEPFLRPPATDTLPLDLACGLRCVVEEKEYVIDRLLNSVFALTGRGTVVYAAHCLDSSAVSCPDPTTSNISDVVVIKLSWQLVTKEPEDEVYRIAARHGVSGVARLYGSGQIGTLSAGIRGQLLPRGGYKDRELRVQVTGPCCRPLSMIDDVEVFKKAFRSLVTAHHELYERTGILHRDITPWNLMVLPSDPSVGVLIDFDLAARLKDDEQQLEVQTIEVGTYSFRSVDLFNVPLPPRPYYRHDLESFFFCLAWIVIGQIDQDTGRATRAKLEAEWERRAPSARISKIYLFAMCKQGWLSGHHSLMDTWIQRLGRLFSQGYGAYYSQTAQSLEGYDRSTFAGNVTYEKFMDCIAD